MANFANIPLGLKITSQIPFDYKSYVLNEDVLKNLGTNNNLAYTYHKGLIVYCALENTRYEWREAPIDDSSGLLTSNFIYPDGLIVNSIDYSLKEYNFFKVQTDPIYIEEGNNVTIVGDGKTPLTPMVISSTGSPFVRVNDGYRPTTRDEIDYQQVGNWSYDFSLSKIGAYGFPAGQIGQIGVPDDEHYGAIGAGSLSIGFNNSVKSNSSLISGRFNYSTLNSDYSTIFGNNNHNESINGFISGSFNRTTKGDKGYSTIFGNGNNVINGANFTLGFGLSNNVSGLTVIGQANSNVVAPSETLNVSTNPLFIIGNGNVTSSSSDIYTVSSRSNALEVYKRGLILAPSLTNSMLDESGSNKALITKEYLNFVVQEHIDSLNVSQDLEYETIWYTGDSNTFTIPEYNFISGVFINGVKLSETAFTKPTSTTVTLLDTLLDDDLIQIQYSQYINGLDLGTYTISQIDNKFLNYYDIPEIDDLLLNISNSIISVTYDELIDLRNNNSFIVNQAYLLTDYISFSSSITEPLILTATSTNQLHKICKSQLYSQDIIYYEISGDIGNGYGTEGFTKGKIYRRIDTWRNNDIGTDWRHVEYNISGQPRTFFLPNSGYNNCRNNKIETNRLFNSVVGTDFRDNTIKDIYNTTIGDACFDNTIDSLYSSTISSYFQYNKIITCGNNTISSQFIGNTIGRGFDNNIIGQSFSYNVIGDDFKQNTIDINFINNDIKYNFSNNFIGFNFRNNNIERGFVGQTIGNIFNNRITVNDLPTGLTYNQRFIVTDALTPTYLSTVVGGGAILTPVMWNGSNWIVC